MFGLGATELIIILVLVLVLFGAGKIPQVMEDLGKGVKSFKNAVDDAEADDKPAVKSAGKAVVKKAPAKKAAAKAKKRA